MTDKAISARGGPVYTGQPLREYPRPQMVRDSYLNLNGPWQYAITESDLHPDAWEGTIVVPFSPESALSGVGRTLRPGERLWYRRCFTLAGDFKKERVLLHFGAVDQCCTVYLNRWEAGGHRGGFLPFTVDITNFCLAHTQELTLRVTDDTDAGDLPCGRQRLRPGGPWRPPQSGIWQTVWLESVPKDFIAGLHITPLPGQGAVEVEVEMETEPPGGAPEGRITVLDGGETVAWAPFTAGCPLRIELPGFKPWSPDSPILYGLRADIGGDRVDSYFGMRRLEVRAGGDGRGILTLNGVPFFGAGVLDQGYFPGGMNTPPTDGAMLDDLLFAKACGFNMIRKHGKIEPLRWYYHCDRLGLLVWQDLPAAGEILPPGTPELAWPGKDDTHPARFGLPGVSARTAWLRQMEQAAAHLRNCPCLGVWVLFNRGQGQYAAAEAAGAMRRLDPTRLVDHASGLFDQRAGDILSLHTRNTGAAELPAESGGRAAVITRCGGFGREALAADLAALYENQLAPLAGRGLWGFVLEQLSDAGDEATGLLTADRTEHKVHPRGLARLNDILRRRTVPKGEEDAPDAAGDPAGGTGERAGGTANA